MSDLNHTIGTAHGQIECHEIARLFPPMTAVEFEAFKANIAEHGLREPIWTYGGKIIDGRNRFLACTQLGIAPAYREWDGQGSLLEFVLSLNLHRRHLDEIQRAMVAARIAGMRQGERTDLVEISTRLSQPQAAALVNVSRASVILGRKVLEHGEGELIEAVERGAIAVSTAATLTQLAPEVQREVVKAVAENPHAATNAASEVRRQERIGKLIEAGTPSMAGELGRFALIYADPPWRYEHPISDSRDIENQYPTMALADICALPVAERALSDCVLLLWAPSSKLAEAMEVLSAWGFSYRTCAVWDKEVIGPGYFFRQQHELLLLAARGSPPAPAPSDRVASVIRSRRRAHSEKPQLVYEIIERMYPALPKLELFARARREGWSAWGNQAAA
jgi:N6-adenosine-specific RNA methylase IME4/ParB-like chromosome segregation protein Spo0J